MAKGKYKTIYTLSIYLKLKQLGFEPVLENDNVNKPGFKCWVYEVTPEFMVAFTKIANKEG